MAKLYIEGGNKLSGEIVIQGSKNSALPILAATLLVRGETVIHNCPCLSDVNAAIKILTKLGCSCKRENSTVTVDATNVMCDTIPVGLMREMRSSVVFLGAILSRCGRAEVSAPGGCELGPRPIDMHLKALKELGYNVSENNGNIVCKKDRTPTSRIIRLRFPSVGATENILLASSCLDGVTVIHGAAREPEIKDLADFINACGGTVKGAGSSTIEIIGAKRLYSAEHSVIADRIAAATYLSAAAITGGNICINKINARDMSEILKVYSKTGSKIAIYKNKIILSSPSQMRGVGMVKSMVYPGFPTDAGPTLVAMLTRSKGNSVFEENIFESRFKYIDELNKFGAGIKVKNKSAYIIGPSELSAASVSCTDLRGGAALVVAALAAKGTSVIDKIYHIDRGYEKIEHSLKELGAKIKRIE